MSRETMSIGELERVYAEWCTENGLPDLGSADDALADRRLSDRQRTWIRLFCTAWDGAQENEWHASFAKNAADDTKTDEGGF